MHGHGRVGVVSRRHLFDGHQIFQVEDDDSSGCEDGDLRLSGIEAHFFEDAASLDKVSLRSCSCESVYRDYFVFLTIVRSNCQEVVSLCLLEFNMLNIVSS